MRTCVGATATVAVTTGATGAGTRFIAATTGDPTDITTGGATTGATATAGAETIGGETAAAGFDGAAGGKATGGAVGADAVTTTVGADVVVGVVALEVDETSDPAGATATGVGSAGPAGGVTVVVAKSAVETSTGAGSVTGGVAGDAVVVTTAVVPAASPPELLPLDEVPALAPASVVVTAGTIAGEASGAPVVVALKFF